MTKRLLKEFGLLLFPFILALPLPLSIKSFALILFFATCLTIVDWRNIKGEKNRSVKLIFFLFVFFFLWESIISFLLGNRSLFHEVRISFLIAPIIFLIAGKALTRFRPKILIGFTAGVYVYILFSIAYVFYFFVISGSSKDFAFNYYLKYILYNYLPGAIHHTYLGMYICLALTIVFFEFKINLLGRIILSLFLLISLPLLGSKASLFMALMLVLLWVVKQFEIKVLKFIIPVFVVVAVYIYKGTDFFRTFSNSLESRLSLLDCAYKGTKENILFGIGNDNIKMFMEKCTTGAFVMDVHNMYVQEMLSSGVLSLVLLLLLLVVIAQSVKRNLTAFVFIVMFAYFGMFEHLLNTQLGVTYFIFFSLLFVVGANRENDYDDIHSSILKR